MTDLEALDVRYRGRPPAGGEHAERCLALVRSEAVATKRLTAEQIGFTELDYWMGVLEQSAPKLYELAESMTAENRRSLISIVFDRDDPMASRLVMTRERKLAASQVKSRLTVRHWFESQPRFAELREHEQERAIERFLRRVYCEVIEVTIGADGAPRERFERIGYGRVDDARHDLERELAYALEDFQVKASRALAKLDKMGGAYAIPEAVRVMRARTPWMLRPRLRPSACSMCGGELAPLGTREHNRCRSCGAQYSGKRTLTRWTMARALALAPEFWDGVSGPGDVRPGWQNVSSTVLTHGAHVMGLIPARGMPSLRTLIDRARAERIAE